ncbi:M20 family metallo-hydrolase, partial [candidate division KSB1 bacterium]|nr:M20 family metallo-hydrolase [candidate division KSB1 bacterium]
MDKTVLEKICKRIDEYQDEAINLEKELTAIPALAPESDGDGEQKKSEFIHSYLQNELHCQDINSYHAPDDRVSSGHRPNLIAKFKGKSSRGTIWIMSHMDVVPPGDLSKWNGDPWTTKVEDGKIFGRGTEDNQQAIVSSLLTVKAFLDEGIEPEKSIGLIFVADEETGSHYGIQYLLENHKDLFRKEDFFLIPDAGNEDGTLVEVAEKSIIWFKFEVLGKQTHGSTPELGVNAHKAGANLIVELEDLYKTFNVSDKVFDPPISTFEPTKKEANVPNVNTIPGEDIFYYDCRLLPNYDVDDLWKNVKDICKKVEEKHGVSIAVISPQELRAAPATPVDAPVVKAIQRAISEIRGVETEPKGIGGGTVAAFFREAGFNSVVWATQDETLHEPNEYVKIDNILDDAKV